MVESSTTTTMKSTLFGNAKVDTSIGKRISRLKRAASLVNLDEEGPKHNRANLHKKASTGKNSTTAVCTEAGDKTSNNEKQLTEILCKSLALIETQGMEQERQKNNFLKECILRDELAALFEKTSSPFAAMQCHA